MSMYLKGVSHYIPEERVPNSWFLNVNGLSDEWIFDRTGIRTRSRAAEGETTNTMAIRAVRNLEQDLSDVDMIIGASYSMYDTVATIAHVVQREFNIKNAVAVTITAACSSLINAMEIVEGYFAMNKSKKALIVASEHNWQYSHPEDEIAGHLWGDGAAAMIITKEDEPEGLPQILDIYTVGLGHVGQGPEAVYLVPSKEGLVMPNGRDVFIYATTYMEEALKIVLERNNFGVKDLTYIVPHQANDRIIANIAKKLHFDRRHIFTNIQKYGNTGSASTAICLSENRGKIKKGDLIGMTVFGGGYSAGSALIRY